MRKFVCLISALAVHSVAIAEEFIPPYQEKSGMMGIGYKDNIRKDGSWAIYASYPGREPYTALNVAMYRAAELSQNAGKPYVQILGGGGSASYGAAKSWVYARASDSPSAPDNCEMKRCYTADVAKLLEALGGADGKQPGVPKPTIDEHGRTVTTFGFGVGAVAWADRKKAN